MLLGEVGRRAVATDVGPEIMEADGEAAVLSLDPENYGPPHLLRAKKIALIGNQVETLIRFRGPLIRDLVLRGAVVYALVPGYTELSRTEVRKLGAVPVDILLHRTSLSIVRWVREVVRLSAILRELQPDVVFSYFVRPIIVGSLAARISKVPTRVCLLEGAGYLYTMQETQGFARRALRALVTELFRAMLAGSDGVFVLNPDDEALITRLRVMPKERVTRLPGIGIDLEFFRPAAQVQRPITFMLAARLIPEKGIRDFVEAARQVRAQHPEARFLLLGGADEHPSQINQKEVKGWVNEGLIEWAGHVDDVRPYMVAASVYVLPSFYREGLPRSLLEAMAMARPIITTDATGCRQAVIEGENGFLVPVRDPGALAAAMMRFIRQPELIVSMGRASRSFAERRFDVHQVNATLIRAMALETAATAAERRRSRHFSEAGAKQRHFTGA